jgi:hypothetical protein
MNILILALLAVSSLPVFGKNEQKSCSYRLAPAPEQVRHRIRFTESTAGLATDELRLIEDWVGRHGINLIEDGQGRLNGMAFDNRDGQLDRGFLMDGTIEDDTFVVSEVFEHKKGYNHFKRLAQARQTKPIEIALGRKFLKCPTIKISGAAQIKLFMKHRLELEDVIDVLRVTRSTAAWQPDRNRGRMRYVLDDVDREGRRLRVVINHDGHCPNELITAYEVY